MDLGLRFTVVLISLGAALARAQVLPPVVELCPGATWPEGVPPAAEAVSVTLSLVVEENGELGDVVVHEGVGDPFDQAAISHVRNCVFRAATVDGASMRARILYRVDFEPPDRIPVLPIEDAAIERAPELGVPPESEQSLNETTTEQPVFGASVEARPDDDPLRRTIDAEEMGRLAGTRGDPIRSLELLPGVARPPLLSGSLIVRGSAPRDSAVFFDGVEIPLLYHFGGLTSVVPGRRLESIDFLPGGFSVRYGRRIGGVVSVTSRDVEAGLHGGASFAVLDSSAHVEGGSRARAALSIRRSLVDVLFRNLIPTDVGGDVAAPAYWDYQAFADIDVTPRDVVRIRILGAHDKLQLDLGDPNGEDPAIRGNLGGTQQFHLAQLRWERRLRVGRQDISVAIGPHRYDAGIGELGLDLQQALLQVRSEWRINLNPAVSIRAGIDLQASFYNVDFLGPPPRQVDGGGKNGALASEPVVALQRRGQILRPAVYLESRFSPGDWASLSLGLRVDHFSEIEESTLDPRVILTVRPHDRVRVSAHVGLFSQAPELPESDPTLGNDRLDPIRAMHAGGGISTQPVDGLRLGVDVFGKKLWELVVNTPDRLPPRFASAGEGRIYGAELFARVERGPVLAQVSYTWSRSERRDADRWRRFDFDQPHVLAVATMINLPRGWSAGATFRYASGNPTTTVVGSVYDAANDVYIPINGDSRGRDRAFRRLDLRIEKLWKFVAGGSFRVFLDLQNATNATNADGIDYSYDYAESRPVRGLPILPSFGIGGER